MPAPIASTFLSAPAISQPTTSGFVYTRNVGAKKTRCNSSATVGVRDRDDRRGRLAGRDLAREVRAGQHADAVGLVIGEHLGDHLGHAQQRSLLDALGQAHDRAPDRTCGRASASTARRPCDGTANTTTSAPAHASARSAVARSSAGSAMPGR